MKFSVHDDKGFENIQYIVKELSDELVTTKNIKSSGEIKEILKKYTDRLIQANLEKDKLTEMLNIERGSVPIGFPNIHGCASFIPGSKRPTRLSINFNYYAKAFITKNPVNRMKAVSEYMETLQHEYRHCKQNLCITSKYNPLNYSQEELYTLSLEKFAVMNRELVYKYKSNYRNFFLESDARQAGQNESIIACKKMYEQLYNYYPEAVERDYSERACERELGGSTSGNKMSYLFKVSNHNDIVYNCAKKHIEANVNKLKYYNSLKYSFNKDGSVKTMEQILADEEKVKENLRGKSEKEIEDYYNLFSRVKANKLLYDFSSAELTEYTKRNGVKNVTETIKDTTEGLENLKNVQLSNFDSTSKDSLELLRSNERIGKSIVYDNVADRVKNRIKNAYTNEKNLLLGKIKEITRVPKYTTSKEIRKSLDKEKSRNIVNEFNAKYRFKILKLGGRTAKLFRILPKSNTKIDYNRDKVVSTKIRDFFPDDEKVDLNSCKGKVEKAKEENEYLKNILEKANDLEKDAKENLSIDNLYKGM